MGGPHLTYEAALKAAKVYSKTGCTETAGKAIGRSRKTALDILRTRKAGHPEIAELVARGKEVSQANKRAKAIALNRHEPYHVQNDLALQRHREIHDMRAATPSPTTIGQKLMGEPLSGHSALNKVETDGRGNISKGDELRSPLGPIRIPDIRINSTHSP